MYLSFVIEINHLNKVEARGKETLANSSLYGEEPLLKQSIWLLRMAEKSGNSKSVVDK